METIDTFDSKVKQKQDGMFNILQGALILLLVINRLDDLSLHGDYYYFLNSLAEKHYRALFKGLCTIPDWRSSTNIWPEFTLIEKVFFKSNIMKADIVRVLTAMYEKASCFRQAIPEVLFSIPIFHFAQGVWEPFKDATEVLTHGSEIEKPFDCFKGITTKW